jgi:hypothetical protein
MHPGYNTPEEIEVMENVPMSRVIPDPWASQRGFWESPQRIVRYNNLIRAAPTNYKIPDWVPVSDIQEAYKYMRNKNAGLPSYAWRPLDGDDPVTTYLRSMQSPPDDIIWTSKGPARIPTAAEAQQADVSPFATPGTYENMPWYGKAALSLLTPSTQYNGQSNVERGLGSLANAVPGAITGGAIGGALGGPAGAVVGALALGLGTAYQSYTGEEIPVFSDVMNIFNVPAQWTEQGWGTIEQTLQSDKDAQEVFNNLPAAWRASLATYEASQGLGAIGKGAIDLAALLSGDTAAGPGRKWAFEKGIYVPVDVLGAIGVDALAEARKRIANGEDPQAVYADMVDRFGISGTFNDFIDQTLVDPTNLLPLVEGKVGEKIARTAGNERLASAFKENTGNPIIDVLPIGIQNLAEAVTGEHGSGGLIGTAGTYKSMIQSGYFPASMQPVPAKELSPFEKWFGGLDENGEIKILKPQTNTGVKGFFEGLRSLTPKAKAFTFLNILSDNIDSLLAMSEGRPEEMNRLVENAANVDVAQVGEAGQQIIDSPEMATVGGAVKDFVKTGTHNEMLTNWMNTTENRNQLLKLAQMLGVEPGKLLDDLADNPKRVLEQLRQKAVDAGEAGRTIVEAIDAGKYTAESIKKMFAPFTGDNAVPWHPDAYRVMLKNAMLDHVSDFLVSHYDIKPEPWLLRVTQILKTGQSIALLGLNPTYFMNNTLNNMVTRAAQGVFGFMTPRQIEDIWRRSGLDPAKLSMGIGAAGEGAFEGATAVTKASKRKGNAIANAAQADDTIASVQKIVDEVNKKMGVFSTLSSSVEKNESRQAMTIGFLNAWNRLWRPGEGFHRMDPKLETMLDRAHPGMKEAIYSAVQAGMNMTEIENALFGDVIQRGVDSVLDTAAKKIYPEHPEIARQIIDATGVKEEIDRAVKNAKTIDDVDTAFDGVESKVQEYVDALSGLELSTRAQDVAARVKSEGFPAALEVFGAMQEKYGSRWLQHFREWEDVMEKAAGLDDVKRNALIRTQLEKDRSEWKRLNDFELSTYAGIIKGLGIDTPASRQFVQLLTETHENWRRFYEGYDDPTTGKHVDGRNDKYRKFFNRKFKNAEARAVAWDTLQVELEEMYQAHIRTEKATQMRLDDLFAQSFQEHTGLPSDNAKAWRQNVMNVRDEMSREMAAFRDTLRTGNYDADARRTAWNDFLTKVYMPLIAQMKTGEITGAYDLAGQKPPQTNFDFDTSIPNPDAIPLEPEGPAPQQTQGMTYEEFKQDLQGKINELSARYIQAEKDLEIAEKYGTPEQQREARLKVVTLENEMIKAAGNRSGIGDDRTFGAKYQEYQSSLQKNGEQANPQQSAPQAGPTTDAEAVVQAHANAESITAEADRVAKEAETHSYAILTRRNVEEKIRAAFPDMPEEQVKAAMWQLDQRADQVARVRGEEPSQATRDDWYSKYIADVVKGVENDESATPINGDFLDRLMQLSDEDIEKTLKQYIVPFRQLQLTPENWNAEFGPDGIVHTPIGDVKIGSNQYEKLIRGIRVGFFGLIKPTLEEPTFIVQKADGTYLYFKIFHGQNHEIRFMSVARNENGEVTVVSNYPVRTSGIKKEIKGGSLKYSVATTLSATPPMLQQVPVSTGGLLDNNTIARKKTGINDSGDDFINRLEKQTQPKNAKGSVSFLDDGRAIITAFQGGDLSTLVHESGHIFRRQLTGEDLDAVARWTGLKNGEELTRLQQEFQDGTISEEDRTRYVQAEEQFARGYERYMAEPTDSIPPKMRSIFQQFSDWLREIYGKVIKGTSIDVNLTPEIRDVMDRLLFEDDASATRKDKAKLLQTLPAGKETTAFGNDPNQTYSFRFRIVDLDSLIMSQTETYGQTPEYPQELQPRIRERAAAREQVNRIARELNPDALLFDTHQIDRGPMIIGSDMVVESGNGRSMALREAANAYPEKYRAYVQTLKDNLAQYGFAEADLEGIDRPVLVRERTSDVDRMQFTNEANQVAVLRMSEFEQSLQDAGLINDRMLANLEVGEVQTIEQALQSPANIGIVRAFIQSLPENERSTVVDAAGQLSQAGYRRLRDAMFAKVYSGEAGQRLLKIFNESADPVILNVKNALFQSLAIIAKAEAEIASGSKDPNLTITPDLSKAVDVYARLKQNRMSVSDYLSQSSMFERELDPFQEQLLGWIAENGRSSKRLRETITGYAKAVIDQQPIQQDSLFGGDVRPTKGQLFDAELKRTTPTDEGTLFAAGNESGAPEQPAAGTAEQPAPAVPPADEAAPMAPGRNELEGAADGTVSNGLVSFSENDIPYEFARDAYHGISFEPEKRARSVQKEYVDHMQQLVDSLTPLADTPEKVELLKAELDRYKQGYLKHITEYLSAKSRVVSTMIAGPANFPAERMNKRSETEHKRLGEFLEWSKKAQQSIHDKLAPEESRSISSDNPDAVNLLKKKIADAEKLQQQMVDANKIVRKKGLTDEQKVEQLVALGISEASAKKLLEPDYAGRFGFPDYALTNNNAEIRRLKGRVEEIGRNQATPASEWTISNGRIVENKEENRIQITFDGKPDEATREKLKSHGFKWAPSQGVWQRQLTDNARSAIRILFPDAVKVEAPAETPAGSTFIEPKLPDEGPGTDVITDVLPYHHGEHTIVKDVSIDDEKVAVLPAEWEPKTVQTRDGQATLLGVDPNDPTAVVYEKNGEVKSTSKQTYNSGGLFKTKNGTEGRVIRKVLGGDFEIMLGPDKSLVTFDWLKKNTDWDGWTSPLEWRPSLWQEAEPERPTNPIGDQPLGSTPTPMYQGEMLDEVASERLRPLINQMRDDFKDTMNRQFKLGDVDEDTRRQIGLWLKQVKNDQASTKLAALRYGEQQRDAALLDYTKQYGFDQILNTVFPYQFWYTRSMLEWGKRMIDKPSWYAMYARLKEKQDEMEQKGLPSRFAGKMRFSAPWLPEWMGGSLYTDPLSQLFPPTQLGRPLDNLVQSTNQYSKQAEQNLHDMVSSGMITTDEMNAAIQSHAGAAWDKALAQAKIDLKDDEGNPMNLVSMMMTPAMYLTTPYYLSQGQPEKIGTLPITRFASGLQTTLKGTPLQLIGDMAGIAAKPEQWARKKAGISEFGEWGDYYIDRMLSDMVGDGTIDPQTGLLAMNEGKGPAYDMAMDRVRQEMALKVPGMSAIEAVKNGASLPQTATALATTLFPAGILPQGELKLRGLQNEYNQAWTDYKNGNDTAINDFFDEHPEYESRLALWDTKEERLRNFLVNQIWDHYSALEKSNRKMVSKELGASFQDGFLNSETRDYTSIDMETLAMWSQLLGGLVPNTDQTKSVAEMSQYQKDQNQLQVYPGDLAKKIDSYNAERNYYFPNYYDAQNEYYSYPEGSADRRKVLKEHPELKQYWSWNRQYKADHPDLQDYWDQQKAQAEEPADLTVNMQDYQNMVESSSTPMLNRQLLAYIFTGDSMSEGATQQLKRIWEANGKPGGTFKEFLATVKAAYLQ